MLKSSVLYIWYQISRSVVSDSLRPHESQHARPPCPSPTPGVHSDSRPSSQWCHPAISSSVIPFSSCPQSLPASVFSNESTLRMRWPKYWSFSFSIIPSKEMPGPISFRMDWLDLLAVAQLCPTVSDPMDCSTPGFPVHIQLPELAQTHVHQVDDAIQPSHPLSSPSPPAFSLSQHQGLFQWVSSSHQVAKVLELQLQHQSFLWVFRVDFL